METIIAKHEQMLYPTVRVVSRDSQGSGTIVYSRKDSRGRARTLAMTNHHVVEDCITVKKRWDPKLGMERKREHRNIVSVEYFKFENYSNCIGTHSVEADIVAYNADEDIALLQLRDNVNCAEYVAPLFNSAEVEDAYIFEPVYLVGAALGESPLPTAGHIFTISKDIDDYRYWGCSAPGIYGVSGGAVYRVIDDTHYEWIGIPSRNKVSMIGFDPDPITHLGYMIPPRRILDFWNDNCYQFIHDQDYTPEACDDLRAEMKKKAERLLSEKYDEVEDYE